MEITEVRIKLMDEDSGERLKAFCSITFDDSFVVRDLKIIEGSNGPFVAMPSRKLTAHCPQCGTKNHLRAGHCNHCGKRLSEGRINKDDDGRAKLYADIAHPINSRCREMIQNRVVEEFRAEVSRAKQDGYVSRYDDIDLDVDFGTAPPATPSAAPPAEPAATPTEVVEIPIPTSKPTPEASPVPQTAAAATDADAAPDENGNNRRKPDQQQTRVQGPESQPPPPHRRPTPTSQPVVTETPEEQPKTTGGFGAGIFED